MACSLGVSRAAIWKHLSHIREQMGLTLYAVPGRGYRLATPLELLDPDMIRRQMPETASALLAELEVFDRKDSTNSYLMQRLGDDLASGHACFCEWQTAGRGRLGRRWVSPFGSNIYLSIHWRFSCGPADLAGLSLAAGLAVARSLERLGVKGVGLKWPNDLLWQQRKLAGLLLEVRGEQGGESQVVVGVGLNTRLGERVGEEIDQPWVDLHGIPGGRELSRNSVAAAALGSLLESLQQFDQNGFEPFMEGWAHYDVHQGKSVSLSVGRRRIVGIHRGVDRNGALLLQTEGGIQAFHGGEISLRGVD
jgi:BirA family biotin operon repressor/biotin-[acetyl-CoA-carboxylase] ligase